MVVFFVLCIVRHLSGCASFFLEKKGEIVPQKQTLFYGDEHPTIVAVEQIRFKWTMVCLESVRNRTARVVQPNQQCHCVVHLHCPTFIVFCYLSAPFHGSYVSGVQHNLPLDNNSSNHGYVDRHNS